MKIQTKLAIGFLSNLAVIIVASIIGITEFQTADETVSNSVLILILSIVTIVGFVIAALALYYINRDIIRQVGGEPTKIAKITQKMAAGNFDIQFETASFSKPATGIYAAIQVMVQNLKTMAEDRKRQNWLETGQLRLNAMMSGEHDIVTLAQNVIGFLTPYVKAQVGLFYLLKEDQKPTLQIIAGYAYTEAADKPNQFELGKGLVGQAALEQKTLSRTQTPAELTHIIQSGLTTAVPQYVLIIPFLYENTVKGVIEIGFSHQIRTSFQQDFLDMVMPTIGIAVNTAQSRTRMQVLLEQTQEQATELQAKQQELQHSNEELQTQPEELRHINEEMEERTKELERQGQEITQKNVALEQSQVEMEKAKAAIETKAKELELASQYKSEFLANMSHELRTPLNSMLILAQILADNKKTNLNEDQLKYAETIYSAGKDLLTLINEILDLAKVESGKMEISLEKVSLRDLVEKIEQKFRHVAESKGLAFQVEIAENLPSSLYTDGLRFKQILNNLLSNAFKFTSDGEIKLTMARPENTQTLNISVADTGIGIPKDKQQQVFEAFQQAEGSTSRRFGGTGLGLSISRQLAILLGGELQLQSEDGQGSTFTLVLPEFLEIKKKSSEEKVPTLTSDESKTQAPAADEASQQMLRTMHDKDAILMDKNILVVDDDIRNTFALVAILEEKCMNVIAGSNGKEALALLEEHSDIDLVLMDIMMPEMDGYEAIQKIREQPRHKNLPIIALTAKAMKGDRAKCIEAGANDYLSKPMDTSQLLSLMRVWLYQ